LSFSASRGTIQLIFGISGTILILFGALVLVQAYGVWNVGYNPQTTVQITATTGGNTTTTTISVSVSQQGTSYVVTGSITPAVGGGQVALTYTKPDGSHIQRTAQISQSSSFADTITPDMNGSWQVTATYNGVTGSATFTVSGGTVCTNGATQVIDTCPDGAAKTWKECQNNAWVMKSKACPEPPCTTCGALPQLYYLMVGWGSIGLGVVAVVGTFALRPTRP